MDHTCFGRRGGFAPISLPLFQAYASRGEKGERARCRSWSPPELLRRTTMDPERETKFRSAFGELRPWVDASLTVAKALLTQSRHYYCLGRGPTKGGELPVSLPSAGVLIRALEPLEGIPIMRLNRGIERLRDLARGPGRLTAALRVGRWPDGLDLWRRSSFVLVRPRSSRISPRRKRGGETCPWRCVRSCRSRPGRASSR